MYVDVKRFCQECLICSQVKRDNKDTGLHLTQWFLWNMVWLLVWILLVPSMDLVLGSISFCLLLTILASLWICFPLTMLLLVLLHQQSNGMVESVWKSIKTSLEAYKLQFPKDTLSVLILRAVKAWNDCISTTSGLSPTNIVNSSSSTTKLSNHYFCSKLISKAYYDKDEFETTIRKGSIVLICN